MTPRNEPLTWRRRSISGRLWTLEIGGKRIASIESGLFARRGRGTFEEKSFHLAKDDTNGVVSFTDASTGLPLGELRGSRLPNTLSVGGVPRYFIGKTDTYEYLLTEIGGRPVLGLSVQKNELITHNYAWMHVRELADIDLNIWFLSAVFMFLVKHNLPVDQEKIEWAMVMSG